MIDLKKLYDISPVFAQNLICSLQGIQIKRQRFNEDFWNYLQEFRKTQYYSHNEIVSYKENKIYNLIETCYNDVPYYNKVFKKAKVTPSDFKQLDDIKKFPVLSKEDVRMNWKSMINRNYNRKMLIHSHTSGSTGKALDFFQTKKSIPFQWAIWWRFRERFNINFHDKHLNFTGKLVVSINQGKPPFWRINKPLNQWLINMQHINAEKIEGIVYMINKEKFKYFSGYPSIIYAFCQLVKDNSLKIVNPPQIVFTGAEKLYIDQKELIEEVIGCKVTDHYGFSEGAGNASKCKFDNYHEDFEFSHLENHNSFQTNFGDFSGELLATGFSNLGMPFLRYQVGDVASWSKDKCQCGLESDVIKDIEGRSEDYVITPEGTKILRFDYIFKDTRDIKEVQIIQKSYSTLLLKIVQRENYTQRTEQKIKKLIKEWISPNLGVEFQYVEEIPRTATGKFRAVISEIN